MRASRSSRAWSWVPRNDLIPENDGPPRRLVDQLPSTAVERWPQTHRAVRAVRQPPNGPSCSSWPSWLVTIKAMLRTTLGVVVPFLLLSPPAFAQGLYVGFAAGSDSLL